LSRLIPLTLFSEIWPDREDPDNPGHYLCRFCGKPTINTRRRYYCSDECYYHCQRAVSWPSARRAAWIRDNKQCQVCGKPLLLYTDKYHPELEITECHHDFPVRKMWRLAWDIVLEADFKDLRWRRSCYDPKDPKQLKHIAQGRAFAILYTLLFLDVNNLQTLCHDCHAMKHAADNRTSWQPPYEVVPTYWAKFWGWAYLDQITRTLDDFFN